MAKHPKNRTDRQIRKGVTQKQSINPNAAQHFLRHKRKQHPLSYYVDGILASDRVILGQAITLIESTALAHQDLAQQIIEACLPNSGQSIRIGITGTPGVGKSTFIEAFGTQLIQSGKRIAALAVDPTSQVTKGSILGDKTRMEMLSTDTNAFIRPSPAGDSLGGVARKTREAIILCEAAAYDTIIIETVGVGQSETAVHSMVDFFLLLLLPGAGDELQGIKRGIVEMADLVVVNKSDGDRQTLARQTKRAYQNALHLFPTKESQWSPKVVTASALQKEGIQEIWEKIQDFYTQMTTSNYFQQHRDDQAIYWLHESIRQQLSASFYGQAAIKEQLIKMEQKILAKQYSPFKAADELLQFWRKSF